MIGLFGSGKFMMVKCMLSIFFFFLLGESLEMIKIYLVVGKLGKDSLLIVIWFFCSFYYIIL